MRDVDAVLLSRFAGVGLNLVGATTVAAYDARVGPERGLAQRAPAARGIVVVGNGGGAFWAAFRAAVPHPVDPADHPLDGFTRAVVEAAARDFETVGTVFPFDARDALDFRLLAELAGLGRPSLLGVLVHPEFGPWIALRAALLVPDAVRAPRPADGFDPCPSCVERPCITACPVGAVGPTGWDVARCAGHRLSEAGRCDDACGARVACVYGGAHRLPPDALAFHQAAARRTMTAYARAATST